MSETEKSGMSRRDFIKSAALVGAMLSVSPVVGGCAAKLAGGIDKGMIELFNGDWLDKIADAVYDLPARAGK